MIIQKRAYIPPLPKKKRVAAYARVSSGKDAMLHSLSAQVSYYSEYIQKHTDWLYCGVYVDEAVTGTKAERENFQRLLRDCRSGKIDLIITKSISRFARNTVTLLETVRELKSLGVDVFFEESNMHTLSASGEMLLTLLASIAEEEARNTSERMRWRVRTNYQNGEPWNGTVYGYRIYNGKYRVEPSEAAVVRYIFQSFLAGKGFSTIANDLNSLSLPSRFQTEWRKNSIKSILQNRMYTGNLLLQKTFRPNYRTKEKKTNCGEYPMYCVEDAHEAIIDLPFFERVQAEINRRSDLYPSTTPEMERYPFTGIITCSVCGKKFRRKKRGDQVSWVCDTKKTFGSAACPSKPVPEPVLMQITERCSPRQITAFTACPDNILTVTYADGTTENIPWCHRSRAESWTPEMKQKAREKAYANHHRDPGDAE